MNEQINLEFNSELYDEPLFEEEHSTEDETIYENEDLVVAKKLNNSNIIKNFSYDQTEILHNIGILYNNGSDQFDADMTASTLGFYNKGRGYAYSIPEPKILMDVFPTRDDIIKISPFTKLPLDDNSINSIICDLREL